MNKAELAAKLAERLGISKKVGEDAVAAFEEIITKELMAGGEVTIAGFGTFSAKERRGRMGVNPQNPTEKIQIPSVIVPKFKAGKALKDALKGKGKLNAPPTPPPAPEPPVESVPIPAPAPTSQPPQPQM
ncbi:HU family DNA-binding protein [Patescibacteria group bacterium]|nr:HU family DNA-binding protein [Patescibacteria group bacterium]MBU1705298.1 HU family DNA-binding protein [Patescibacteria group bacterium]